MEKMDSSVNHPATPNPAVAVGYRNRDIGRESQVEMCLAASQVQLDVDSNLHSRIAAFVGTRPDCWVLGSELGLAQLHVHAFELLGLGVSGERAVAQPSAHEECSIAFPAFDTAGPVDHVAEADRAYPEEM
jgi:hypothetical protein